MTPTASDYSELLQEAKELAQVLRDSLPKDIYAGSLTLKSKLPFKAISIRELLINRQSELVDAAIVLCEADRLVPAFVVTRAAVETTAVTYLLYRNMKQFVTSRDVHQFSEFLMRGLFGSKNDFTPEEAVNVLTAIDHLDKESEDFRKMYDSLCEFTHPNYAGVFGALGLMEEETSTLRLGKKYQAVPTLMAVGPLVISLKLFQKYYNDSAKLLTTLNQLFEQGVVSHN